MYLTSRSKTIELNKKLCDKAQQDEYMKLIKNKSQNSNDKNEISCFSHNYHRNICKISNNLYKNFREVLPNVISKKVPTYEKFCEYLKFLTNKKERFIKFNKFRFNYVFNKSKSMLFSENLLRSFIVGSLFDLETFSEFGFWVCKLNEKLSKIILYSSINEYLLTIDDMSCYIESEICNFKTLNILVENENLSQFYIQFVLEQISFYFDPFNTNKLSPFVMISSENFNKFYLIDENNATDNTYSFAYFKDWYDIFMRLVSDNGMITKNEFKHWRYQNDD